MKKVLLFSALALSFVMISCTDPLVGTWVQPSTTFTQEQGFILQKDGTAEDINMDFVSFKSWEKNGDFLILKGENTGTIRGEFSDTLIIENVTDEELTLSQMGCSITYKKKTEK